MIVALVSRLLRPPLLRLPAAPAVSVSTGSFIIALGRFLGGGRSSSSARAAAAYQYMVVFAGILMSGSLPALAFIHYLFRQLVRPVRWILF